MANNNNKNNEKAKDGGVILLCVVGGVAAGIGLYALAKHQGWVDSQGDAALIDDCGTLVDDGCV